MQAILTKFLSPNDRHGPRIRAFADAGSVTVIWDDELDVYENHERAAGTLAQKLGWVAWRDGSPMAEAYPLAGPGAKIWDRQWRRQWVGGSLPAKSALAYTFCRTGKL
jgi:hypothetical protein